MGQWNSVLNLMHLFAQERGRGYGQSLTGDGSVAAERVGGEMEAWEDADSLARPVGREGSCRQRLVIVVATTVFTLVSVNIL